MAEGNDLMQDMRNDGFRFSHDLVTEVLRIRSIEQRGVRFPTLEHYLLTDSHKILIREFLEENGRYLEEQVEKYASVLIDHKKKYSHHNYDHNRMKVITKFKPKPYSEEGFVKFCAAFAAIAACIHVRNPRSNVLACAFDDVHNYVKTVLSRGTLQQSSLPDNE